MKSEREKMLAGEMYFSGGEELTLLRNKARRLFTQFNQTVSEDIEQRKAILNELIGEKGENIDIQPPFYCDYGINLKFGNNVFINYNCTILDCAEVQIGDNVFIAPSVHIYTALHPLNATERNKGLESAKGIIIEENVWIGGNVTICPGVKIGSGSTIGAGSVVTKDIPPNSLAVGNPCKVIKAIE